MGYYDEKLFSDFIFALKFIAALVIIRLIAYYCGYTAHIPVIDDIIVGGGNLIRDFGKMVEAILNGKVGS